MPRNKTSPSHSEILAMRQFVLRYMKATRPHEAVSVRGLFEYDKDTFRSFTSLKESQKMTWSNRVERNAERIGRKFKRDMPSWDDVLSIENVKKNKPIVVPAEDFDDEETDIQRVYVSKPMLSQPPIAHQQTTETDGSGDKLYRGSLGGPVNHTTDSFNPNRASEGGPLFIPSPIQMPFSIPAQQQSPAKPAPTQVPGAVSKIQASSTRHPVPRMAPTASFDKSPSHAASSSTSKNVNISPKASSSTTNKALRTLAPSKTSTHENGAPPAFARCPGITELLLKIFSIQNSQQKQINDASTNLKENPPSPVTPLPSVTTKSSIGTNVPEKVQKPQDLTPKPTEGTAKSIPKESISSKPTENRAIWITYKDDHPDLIHLRDASENPSSTHVNDSSLPIDDGAQRLPTLDTSHNQFPVVGSLPTCIEFDTNDDASATSEINAAKTGRIRAEENVSPDPCSDESIKSKSLLSESNRPAYDGSIPPPFEKTPLGAPERESQDTYPMIRRTVFEPMKDIFVYANKSSRDINSVSTDQSTALKSSSDPVVESHPILSSSEINYSRPDKTMNSLPINPAGNNSIFTDKTSKESVPVEMNPWKTTVENRSEPTENNFVPADTPSVPADTPSVLADTPSVPADTPSVPAGAPSVCVEATALPRDKSSSNLPEDNPMVDEILKSNRSQNKAAFTAFNKMRKVVLGTDQATVNSEDLAKIKKRYKQLCKKNRIVLESGTVVEEVMEFAAENIPLEHAVHSFIFDIEDDLWDDIAAFTANDEKNIENMKPNAFLEKADVSLHSVFQLLKGKTTFDSLFVAISSIKVHPHKSPALYWVKETLMNALRLFTNSPTMSISDFSNVGDLLDSVFGFIEKIKYTVAGSSVKGIFDRESDDETINLTLKYNSLSMLYAEANFQQERDIHESKYLDARYLRIPKILKDFLSEAVDKHPQSRETIKTIGFIIHGFSMCGIYQECTHGSITLVKESARLYFPESLTEFVVKIKPIIHLLYNTILILENNIKELAIDDDEYSLRKRKQSITPSFSPKRPRIV
ncbi:hypothetical protein INT47_009686 [Mucor saturninus]|uniref:Uncharacterized protein n=1 Tax=Mucor saturninus TaxID=64648 RepID=A0A8H7QKQ4_9FUNG|nr:hypothetical protein INT47_009686 [Mucor saturninus]